jgi:FtsH-binding integral membrane protein
MTTYDNQLNNQNYNQYDAPLQGNDMEMGNDKLITNMMRLGFIRKVYGILGTQLAITAAFVSLALIESVKQFIQTHIAILYVCLGLSFFIAIPLICCKSVARKVPTNYILLSIWTICESYMVGAIASFYDVQTVITAAVMTAAVTLALTAYACTTKTDFTYCGGFLFCFSAVMFCFTLFGLIFNIWLNAFYCVCGVILYSLYLIYDTQLVMGKFGLEYSIDDYVIAAMMIYIDIIQIFLYLLRLLSKK